MIVGNKIDLCENEKSRAVKRRDAEIMAEVNDILDLLLKMISNSIKICFVLKNNNALFFEASSKQARYVFEIMVSVASKLKEKEDLNIKGSKDIVTPSNNSSKCC